MSMIPVALTPLQVGQRTVMQINALLPSVVLVIGGFVLGAFTQARFGIPAWPFALLASVVALWAVLVAPRRRWAAWGWALASDEVHVAHGVWTQVHTIVPLARVQHIDVAQGPLERAFGVARLVLHTAGTAHATVTVPGLSQPEAEQLRDTIRAQIRVEPW